MMEIPFLIAISTTLFAGIYDLKTSDVLEEIPALMISLGLFYWYMLSLICKEPMHIVNSILTGLFFLSLGLLLFKLKFWGDGDAWILGGLGFLLPSLNFPFYPFSFILLIFIIGGIYSLIYIIAYGMLNKKVRKAFVSEFKKYQNLCLSFLILCMLISVFIPIAILLGALPVIYLYSKIIERNMRRKVRTDKLKVGDVIAGREIVGLTKEEIEKLKKERKFVEIQEGVRFTMVFPITLVLVYLF